MGKSFILVLVSSIITFILISFRNDTSPHAYESAYRQQINHFRQEQLSLLEHIKKSDLHSAKDLRSIGEHLHRTREALKSTDMWLRYLEPLAYKKINGPLPVEWETEVFEKFEKPYKREGAGLTLAELYLEEKKVEKDKLSGLIQSSIEATRAFEADSITAQLSTHHHFYLCNRLFLLNLAAIYTTGFECPDTSRIIPELELMMEGALNIYSSFNLSFPNTPLTTEYTTLFESAVAFVRTQPHNYSCFDHFNFIKEYVNPLFTINQKSILQYKVVSRSNIDYALNKSSTSIFSKNLYNGQNAKGIFHRIKDEKVLAEIDHVGKLLFYDPILSANNQRSCVSCHKSNEYFTDTSLATSLQYDRKNFLARNTPSLINVEYNHLLMMDGKHISLQNQTRAVITNPVEMGSDESDIVRKVLSCYKYKKTFKALLKHTPMEKEVTFEHIVSAITFYYSKFSRYSAPFDEAMNNNKPIDQSAKLGFNVFMSKAQCATCHFVPQFNGVKPSYIGSEFEVLGVPADKGYKKLTADKGRYNLNPAYETLNAHRTGSLRNIAHTSPYMHNGVFSNLNEVIDFYDGGGGAGRGLEVSNQTLSSDSLHLTLAEKSHLVRFLESLDESIQFEKAPESLPLSKSKVLNARKVGGEY